MFGTVDGLRLWSIENSYRMFGTGDIYRMFGTVDGLRLWSIGNSYRMFGTGKNYKLFGTGVTSGLLTQKIFAD
jgi:hypothetical protein